MSEKPWHEEVTQLLDRDLHEQHPDLSLSSAVKLLRAALRTERDALARRVEVLSALCTDYNEHESKMNMALDKLVAERDALRTEVEQLKASTSVKWEIEAKAAWEKNEALRTELEQLRACATCPVDSAYSDGFSDGKQEGDAELGKAYAENTALRAALERYGLHRWDCKRLHDGTGCDCGLDAALAHTPEVPR